MPTRTFDFLNAAERAPVRPARASGRTRSRLGIVRALLYLRQGQQGGGAHRAPPRGAGIGVLRFDFTGLGASEGEFGGTGFSHNVDDLVDRRRGNGRCRHAADAPRRPQSWRRGGHRGGGFAAGNSRSCSDCSAL